MGSMSTSKGEIEFQDKGRDQFWGWGFRIGIFGRDHVPRSRSIFEIIIGSGSGYRKIIKLDNSKFQLFFFAKEK